MTRKILLTGAAGKIGSFFRNTYADSYSFVLTDIAEPEDAKGAPFTRADLSDFVAIRPLFEGVDTVVHLGADPSMDASWESLLPNNVIATYNVFEAAHQAGCRRVVYASSINAVLGYPRDQQVHTSHPVYPINLYGATKCWGEALARYYSAAHGLSSLCLRFGAVQDRDSEWIHWDHEYVEIIQTLEDNASLIAAAVEAGDDVVFGNFHGISDNRYKRLDMTDTMAVLNYTPQDDAFEMARRRGNL
ncbi:MAG: NAD(P)-dependent oxidoreductase [Caldilineaceae bacterium]|nr:NAD(P)-dependent oxidoreductase [Caldilineaceae bacterium]